MNLTQAEAIASLYSELVKSIDITKIEPPLRNSYNKTRFDLSHIDSIRIEDGQVIVKWGAYAGCGDYDNDETYHSLDTFFDY